MLFVVLEGEGWFALLASFSPFWLCLRSASRDMRSASRKPTRHQKQLTGNNVQQLYEFEQLWQQRRINPY